MYVHGVYSIFFQVTCKSRSEDSDREVWEASSTVSANTTKIGTTWEANSSYTKIAIKIFDKQVYKT